MCSSSAWRRTGSSRRALAAVSPHQGAHVAWRALPHLPHEGHVSMHGTRARLPRAQAQAALPPRRASLRSARASIELVGGHGRNPPGAWVSSGVWTGGDGGAHDSPRDTLSRSGLCTSHQVGQIMYVPSVFFTPFLLQRRVGQRRLAGNGKGTPPMQATAGKRCRFAFDNERDVL